MGVKRPLGITISALVFLTVGLTVLITGGYPSALHLGHGGKLDAGDFLYSTLPGLVCLVASAGILSMKPWGRWVAFVLAAAIVYSDYYMFVDGTLSDPGAYRISHKMTIGWNIWWVSMAIGMWFMVLLPFVTVYFLVFDKATVAAFKKAPAEPPTRQN